MAPSAGVMPPHGRESRAPTDARLHANDGALPATRRAPRLGTRGSRGSTQIPEGMRALLLIGPITGPPRTPEAAAVRGRAPGWSSPIRAVEALSPRPPLSASRAAATRPGHRRYGRGLGPGHPGIHCPVRKSSIGNARAQGSRGSGSPRVGLRDRPRRDRPVRLNHTRESFPMRRSRPLRRAWPGRGRCGPPFRCAAGTPPPPAVGTPLRHRPAPG